MRRFYLPLFFSLLAAGALAEAPAGYYDAADGKSGAELKTVLHQVISPCYNLDYAGFTATYWGERYFRRTDWHPDGGYWDMYSDGRLLEYDSQKLEREHCLPRSWWKLDSDYGRANSDLHNLNPADEAANGRKSNNPLGETEGERFNNGVSKVGASTLEGYTGTVFEPADKYKGDFARIYFYMVTCYQDYTWRYNYMFSNSTYLSMRDWAIDLLLDWSRNDPVSQKELDRNDAVYSIQGNRNPFVDDPELVEYIWGDRQGEPYSVEHYEGDPVLISPVQDSELNFGEVAVGASQNVDLYIKGEGLTGNLSVAIYGDNRSLFKAAATSIPATNANRASGFQLRITYSPTSVGEHSARLSVYDGGITGSVGVSLTGSCLPVPTLSKLTARQATNVTATSYRANWDAAPADETIDYYVVTRTIYGSDGSSSTTMEQSEENYLDFDDMQPGETHTYYVQSSRLGYLSEPSNTINVGTSSAATVTYNSPLAVTTYEGRLVRFTCNEPHTGCRIHDISGRLVELLPTLESGTTITLPYGAYIITTDQHRTPIKILVR